LTVASAVARPVETAGERGNRLETVRRGSVPVVAFLAACLGLACSTNLVQISLEMGDLSLANERFVGWAGVGACAGIGLALVSLLAAPRLGAAVPLAAGAAAAVFGLALGNAVFDGVRIALALMTLGAASGALLGAACSLTLVARPPRRLLTAVAWALPMLAATPVLDEQALDPAQNKGTLQLGLHPPVWPLAVVSVLLVSWSALSLLLEPGDSSRSRSLPTGGARSRVDLLGSGGAEPVSGAEDAWTAVGVAALVPSVAVMLLGFEPSISDEWLRPLIIVVVAIAVLGLGFACLSVPTAAGRVGVLTVSIVMLCWPACIGVLLLATSGHGSVSRLDLGVLVVAVALGAVGGGMSPARGVVGGLLLLAGGAAGAWVVAGPHPLQAVAVAAMAGGAAAAMVAGLRSGLTSPVAAQLIGVQAVSCTILGVLLALPLSWALGGSLPVTTASAVADARVLLGLTAAAAVFGAGYAATLRTRFPIRR
jgi:hypothetical protein